MPWFWPWCNVLGPDWAATTRMHDTRAILIINFLSYTFLVLSLHLLSDHWQQKKDPSPSSTEQGTKNWCNASAPFDKQLQTMGPSTLRACANLAAAAHQPLPPKCLDSWWQTRFLELGKNFNDWKEFNMLLKTGSNYLWLIRFIFSPSKSSKITDFLLSPVLCW